MEREKLINAIEQLYKEKFAGKTGYEVVSILDLIADFFMALNEDYSPMGISFAYNEGWNACKAAYDAADKKVIGQKLGSLCSAHIEYDPHCAICNAPPIELSNKHVNSPNQQASEHVDSPALKPLDEESVTEVLWNAKNWGSQDVDYVGDSKKSVVLPLAKAICTKFGASAGKRLDKEEIKYAAEDVMHHIHEMYPDAWKAMSPSCRLSVKNTIINNFFTFTAGPSVSVKEIKKVIIDFTHDKGYSLTDSETFYATSLAQAIKDLLDRECSK